MTTLLVHENKPSAAASLPTADDKSDDSDMEDVAPVSGKRLSPSYLPITLSRMITFPHLSPPHFSLSPSDRKSVV